MTSINQEKIIEELDPFFQRRNLKKGTKNNYIIAWHSYCKHHGKTPSELIYEAEQEQIPYINERNQIIIPNPEFTNLKKRLSSYQDMELKKVSSLTTDRRLSLIKAVYKELGNNIRMPTLKKIKPVQKIRVGLTQEKIIKAIMLSNNKYKAVITLLGSSGLRVGDLMNLTVKDWCNSINVKNIEKAVYSKKDYVGFLEFYPEKTSNILCQTFTSPEANNYVKTYLKDRLKKDETLNGDSYLIHRKSKDNRGRGVSRYFKNRNDKLYYDELSDIDKQLQNNRINKEEHEYLKNRISKFKPHALRAYFITTISNHIPNVKINSRLAGHTLPEKTDIHYIKFTRDDLEPHYLKALPYLTFKEEVVVREVTTKDFDEMKLLQQKLEERNRELDRVLERQDYFENLLGDLDKI